MYTTTLRKFALLLIIVSVITFCIDFPTQAATKKSSTKKTTKKPQSTIAFNLDKFITAHRNNDRNGVWEQLVAAKSNWRRTFTINKTSGINLLMIACQNAAEYDAMDAIYTLIENCPDLINARDSSGQTAIYYAHTNSFTIPFQTLINDQRTQVNIETKAGISPLQVICGLWGSKYDYIEQAIWAMLERGADLNRSVGGYPSAIQILINNNEQYLVNKFYPVAQQQASQRR